MQPNQNDQLSWYRLHLCQPRIDLNRGGGQPSLGPGGPMTATGDRAGVVQAGPGPQPTNNSSPVLTLDQPKLNTMSEPAKPRSSRSVHSNQPCTPPRLG